MANHFEKLVIIGTTFKFMTHTPPHPAAESGSVATETIAKGSFPVTKQKYVTGLPFTMVA